MAKMTNQHDADEYWTITIRLFSRICSVQEKLTLLWNSPVVHSKLTLQSRVTVFSLHNGVVICDKHGQAGCHTVCTHCHLHCCASTYYKVITIMFICKCMQEINASSCDCDYHNIALHKIKLHQWEPTCQLFEMHKIYVKKAKWK